MYHTIDNYHDMPCFHVSFSLYPIIFLALGVIVSLVLFPSSLLLSCSLGITYPFI